MSILTTCIGAYPKPEYVRLPDWFNSADGPDMADPTKMWADALKKLGPDAPRIIQQGIQEAVTDQVDCGIDIPTDGEIVRENYIHYHCRHLNGFDFEILTSKEVRGGTYCANLPSITGPVSLKKAYIVNDWKIAQSFTNKPLKITLPGPMTVADTNTDIYYNDPKKLGSDLAETLNAEVLALANAGCRHIQIDEPVFARRPRQALDYGFENLEKAFHGCPDHVVRTAHICCGYPDRLDNPDYPKADREAYHQIADTVEMSTLNAVSFEDAHRPNDLRLLEHFKTTSIILGVVAIAKSKIESVEEIRERLSQALNHIDSDRLIAAPDCGLGLLGRDLAMAKLKNLSEAAHSL